MSGSKAELEAQIAAAVEAVRRGEVIGLPTDTVYGVGADPRRAGAARRVFAAKGRPESVALPVLIADAPEADRLAVLDARARALTERYWPGPLTLVLARRPGVDLHLGGDPGTVGLRCPASAIARELLARTGPLAVTSANRHGGKPATTADAVRRELGSAVTVVVDGGGCGGSPSSVLSLAGEEPVLLREGSVALGELLATIERAGA